MTYTLESSAEGYKFKISEEQKFKKYVTSYYCVNKDLSGLIL